MDNMILLNRMKELLDEKFPHLIDRVILFGSRVDGTARDYSDYDILVIANEPVDWKVKDEIRSVLYDLNIEYDILISVQVVSDSDLSSIIGKQPFIQHAIETGISV